MFGRYYAQRDTDLKADPTMQSVYARQLLAEILTRAKVLEALLMRAIEADDVERRQYLEELALAVEMYLHDVDEASIRAQRARLCAEGGFGVLSEDIACQDLADIGGELIPANAVE